MNFVKSMYNQLLHFLQKQKNKIKTYYEMKQF